LVTDKKIRQLIRLGFRARLEQSPPLVGARSIALVQMKGAKAAKLTSDGVSRRIPSAAGTTSLEDITSQADQILAKVNGIPIEEIGQSLKIVTSWLAGLISSPKIEDSLSHLNHGLAQLDLMLGDVQPKIGPLVSKLNEAAPVVQITRQVLTADLIARLPQGRVIFPHLTRPVGAIGINVDLLSFSADREGARLHVSWVGTSAGSQPQSCGGTMVLLAPRLGAGSASMASALSTLLAQLADGIVAQLMLLNPVVPST
jgi:hypothetical protein